MKYKFVLSVDTSTGYFTVTNLETEESKDIEIPKRRKNLKPKVVENPNPQLTLGANSYKLNTAAVEALGVEAGDKIDIKYEKRGVNMVPVIGNATVFGTNTGNKVTKGFSVSYRGKSNEELSKRGVSFDLVPHEKYGLFILVGDKKQEEVVEEVSNNIQLPSSEPEIDIDLENSINSIFEEDTTDISALDFSI